MPHPLVTQLRFSRSEFRRAIDGVTAEEAARRFEPINLIAWITGHLAWTSRNMLDRNGSAIVVHAQADDYSGTGRVSTQLSERRRWHHACGSGSVWG